MINVRKMINDKLAERRADKEVYKKAYNEAKELVQKKNKAQKTINTINKAVEVAEAGGRFGYTLGKVKEGAKGIAKKLKDKQKQPKKKLNTSNPLFGGGKSDTPYFLQSSNSSSPFVGSGNKKRGKNFWE